MAATTVDFTLNGVDGNDIYTINHANGHNLPMTVRPQAGTFVRQAGNPDFCHAAVSTGEEASLNENPLYACKGKEAGGLIYHVTFC